MLHALDPDEHLVQVPFVSGSRPSAAQAVGKALAEFLAPAPDGLIGDDNAPLGQEQLDITQAEAEHVVQPDSMADDLGREAMAVVRVGWWLHAAMLSVFNRLPDPVTVTMPTRRLIPLLMVCYFTAYLDRVNVGFAALTMNKALGFSAAVFGLGSGIFFVGYFLFEVPATSFWPKSERADG